jgi:DedD protein
VEGASKERITGAVILVAALAIAVPELLSGPDQRAQDDAPAVVDGAPPLTTYDLAIDPSARPGAARQQELASAARAQSEAIAEAVPPPVTAPAAVTAPEPDPVATTPSPSAPAAQPPAAAQAAAPAVADARKPTVRASEKATAPPAPAAAPAATGKWWVQLGSFSSADNAQRLARDLRGKGFVIDVSVVKSGGRQLHRVRAGPEKDRDTAVALRTRLASAGQQGTLVAP